VLPALEASFQVAEGLNTADIKDAKDLLVTNWRERLSIISLSESGCGYERPSQLEL
jgi:hypothetical protein